MIRAALPGVHYAVKWKKAHYGLPEHGWIIEVVAYDVSVNVVFFARCRLRSDATARHTAGPATSS